MGGGGPWRRATGRTGSARAGAGPRPAFPRGHALWAGRCAIRYAHRGRRAGSPLGCTTGGMRAEPTGPGSGGPDRATRRPGTRRPPPGNWAGGCRATAWPPSRMASGPRCGPAFRGTRLEVRVFRSGFSPPVRAIPAQRRRRGPGGGRARGRAGRAHAGGRCRGGPREYGQGGGGEALPPDDARA
jgi:hypothetical protein